MDGGSRPRVALLRGINLGAARRLPMAELRQVVTGLGWQQVATYLQSGNVIFQAPGSDADVAERLSSALAERFGLRVDVVVRDGVRLGALLAAHPFADGDPAQVVIACCDRIISADALARLEGLRSGAERLQPAESGCDLYASFPGGQARSRLAAGLIAAIAPATGTVRNLRTLGAVADLLGAEPAG